MAQIAWGKKVGPAFKNKVIGICEEIGADPNHLMAAMAFETGERFTPDVQNKKSKATGLIQFMPATAASLGTSIDALKQMSAVQQLDYVRAYFLPHTNKLHTLSDVYMAILWPAAIGKMESAVLFKAPSKTFQQNSGLDVNKDGQVTKGEAADKVQKKLSKGLGIEYRG